MLKKLINKKNLNVLGINSGTSADSLDLALVRITDNKAPKFIEGKTVKLPSKLKNKIFQLADTDQFKLDELIYLDNYFGQFIGLAAKKYITDLKKRKISVDTIASHGQTVRHLPKKVNFLNQKVNGTMQLGSPEFIATATNKIVVADFRQADIALGGEGAPITTDALRLLLQGKASLVVNIGGMSNYFFIPKSRQKATVAADCGPGNVLSDLLTQKLFSKPYDKNGSLAQKGIVSKRLLSILLAHPFFKNRTGSTGREDFGLELSEKIISFKKKLHLSKHDLLATASELTVRAISGSIRPLLAKNKEIKKLYLTGGGRKNIFFKSGLTRSLEPLPIEPIDELGLDGDYTEAICYAIMGAAAIKSKSLAENKLNRRPLLGRIVQPPK